MRVSQKDALLVPRYIKILMDNSARASIIRNDLVRINNCNTRKTSANRWSKMARSFATSCKAKVRIKLPELNTTAHISAPFHVTDQNSNCYVIFDRDLLREL